MLAATSATFGAAPRTFPEWPQAAEGRVEFACRRDSVPEPVAGVSVDDHPSLRSTRKCLRTDRPLPARSCSGRGLPSRPGHPDRWCALTAPFHPYQPLRGLAVCSLWHFPAGRPGWPLTSALPCGVPTFLDPLGGPRPSSTLHPSCRRLTGVSGATQLPARSDKFRTVETICTLL